MSDDEAALEVRVRTRDADALVVYLELKKLPLISFIERKLSANLRQRVETDDVYQETVLAAFQFLVKTDQPIVEPFAWLCHLAEQRVVDLARRHLADKRDVRREVSGNTPAPGLSDTSGDLIALLAVSMTSVSMKAVKGERQARLEACLAELPEQTREILRLRYGDGLSTKEIAQRVGKTDVAVRVLLSRAVQDLQKKLLAGENS